MKKWGMVWGMIGCLVLWNQQGIAQELVLATEGNLDNEISTNVVEEAEINGIQEGNQWVLEPNVTQIQAEVTGYFGTVPWVFDTIEQVLTFGGGNFPLIYEQNTIQKIIEGSTSLSGQKIKKIIFTEPVQAHQQSSQLFSSLANLQTIENLQLLDTSQVISMNHMFSGCSKLTELVGIGEWDTGQVIFMGHMFSGCSSLTRLELTNWQNSVDYMWNIFYSCSNVSYLDINSLSGVLTDSSFNGNFALDT